jgi:hypothetical protein
MTLPHPIHSLSQFSLEHHHVGTLHVNPEAENSRLPPHVFCIAQDAYSNAIMCVRNTARSRLLFFGSLQCRH